MQSIDEFLDKISSKCKYLERFEYNGGELDEHNITTTVPEIPLNDEQKFTELTSIKLQFGFRPQSYHSIAWRSEMIENFVKYLKVKCPNLKKPISVKVEKSEVWKKQDYRSIIFESW